MTARVFRKPEGGSSGVGIEFVRPSKLAESEFTGVVLEGTFLEAITNPFDETKNDFKFEKEDGTTVIVNHSGSLAYEMKNVSPGDFCQVSYQGKVPMRKGKMKGKEAHQFEVLIA